MFDQQAALARQLGLADTPARRASEQLMQRYYRAAKLVRQVNTILLQNLHARLYPAHTPPVPFDAEFQRSTSCSTCATRSLFARRPAAMLDAFLMLQKHRELKGMTARTLRALWRNRHLIDVRFRRDPANRARFIEMFRLEQGPPARAAPDEPVRHPRPVPAGRSAASSGRCSTTSSTSTRSTSTS